MTAQRLTVGMTVTLLQTTTRWNNGNPVTVRGGSIGTVASVELINSVYRVDFPGAPGFILGGYLLRTVVTA